MRLKHPSALTALRSSAQLIIGLGLVVATYARADSPEQKTILVTVADTSSHTAVKGARVFVLDARGAEIASAVTHERGMAKLPPELEQKAPKYVLVEEDHHFISGLTWLSGSRDYYILTLPLVARWFRELSAKSSTASSPVTAS